MKRPLLFGALLVIAPAPARAADVTPVNEEQSCAAARAEGLAQRDAGRLLAAKEEFSVCAAARCPLEVREECAALRDELLAATPSVVFEATDEQGGELAIARVAIDGSEVEPRSGSAEPAPAPDVGMGKRPLAYALAGVGALALGGFAYFALDGKSQQLKLDECKPSCRLSSVDEMRRAFLLADISLGVALVSFGVGGYFFFADSGGGSTATRQEVGLAVGGRF